MTLLKVEGIASHNQCEHDPVFRYSKQAFLYIVIESSFKTDSLNYAVKKIMDYT